MTDLVTRNSRGRIASFVCYDCADAAYVYLSSYIINIIRGNTNYLLSSEVMAETNNPVHDTLKQINNNIKELILNKNEKKINL